MVARDADGAARAHTPDYDFRMMRQANSKDQVGPGTYSPQFETTKHKAAKHSFGKQERFAESKQSFISKHHQSDLLCTTSPGPKYYPDPSPAKHKAPAYSWGEKLTAEQRAKKLALQVPDTDVGPSTYKPKHTSVLSSAPRPTFGKQDRFGGSVGYLYVNSTPAEVGPGTNDPDDHYQAHKAPSFSFGKKKNKEQTPGEQRSKPRTSFMTHSIAGGLARPATMECNIGPGDYHPKYNDINENSRQAFGFGTSSRFIKAGVQFLSPEHAKSNVGHIGPGPKYYSHISDLSYEPKAPRGAGLKWVP